MNITQLVFSWPREAQYSCEPSAYEGWAIEDYDFEISGMTPQLGDSRTWEGQKWQVSQIEEYGSDDDPNSSFSVAVLTLDGNPAERDPWEGSGERVMYACISPDDVLFGLPEDRSALPQLGSEVKNLPGWRVSTIREFEPQASSTYDRVFVCWCAAIAVPSREAIAA